MTEHSFPGAIGFAVARHKWGILRKVSLGAVKVTENRSDDEVTAAVKGVSKQLIDTRLYASICQLDNWIDDYLSEVAEHVPYLRPGMYLMPLRTWDRDYRVVTEWCALRQSNVDEFLEEYQSELLPRERTRLGKLYDPGQYPSSRAVQQAFWVELSFPPIDSDMAVDRRLEALDIAAYEAAIQRAEKKTASAVDQIRLQQRETLLERTATFEKPLRDRSTLRDPTVDQLWSTLLLLGDKDVTGDGKLQDVRTRLEQALVTAGLQPPADPSAGQLRKLAKICGKPESKTGRNPAINALCRDDALRDPAVETLAGIIEDLKTLVHEQRIKTYDLDDLQVLD